MSLSTKAVEQLLTELGATKLKVAHKSNSTWVNGCCPMHSEYNPSFGVNVDMGIYTCYVCGSGSLIKLVMQSKGYTYKQAVDFLEPYGVLVDLEETGAKIRSLPSYGGLKKINKNSREREQEYLPNYHLALLKSGKVFHQYILDRGFSKDDCRKFLYGWDAESNRVTIPVLTRDDKLCGFIRRAVLDNKLPDGSVNPEYEALYGNMPKYLIDDSIVKSKCLYPLPHFILGEDNSAIVVEGQIDSQHMHKLGFPETLSIINSKINAPQVQMMVGLGIKKLYAFLDNDEAGETGFEHMKKMLKGSSILLLRCGDYPPGKNDPAELSYEDVMRMKKEARFLGIKKLIKTI